MLLLFFIFCTVGMVGSVFLLLIGLPGIWLIFGFAFLWDLIISQSGFTGTFFVTWGLLGGLAELTEFFAGYYGSKKFGGTKQGSWGGILGALLGGITGASFLFGFGAIVGALAGGFLGSLFIEISQGMATKKALTAALGVTFGRLLGLLIKLSVAIALLCAALPLMWQRLLL